LHFEPARPGKLLFYDKTWLPAGAAIVWIGVEIGTLAAAAGLIGRTAVKGCAITGTGAIATLLSGKTAIAAPSAIERIEL
jgi:hypothetical protein